MPSFEKLVCISGTSWSGSTLLDYVLGSLPGVTGVGEVCNLMAKHEQALYRQEGGACIQCRSWECPVFTLDLLKRTKTLSSLYGNVQEAVGTSSLVVSDKNPATYQQTLPSIVASGCDVRLVCLFKRPEAFVRSDLKRFTASLRTWRNQRVVANVLNRKTAFERNPQGYIQSRCAHYSEIYRNLLLVATQLQIPVRGLFYEDFARWPARTLLRLCQWLGLNYSHAALNYWAHEHHMINGNRGVHREQRPITLDISWQTELPAWVTAQVSCDQTAQAAFHQLLHIRV